MKENLSHLPDNTQDKKLVTLEGISAAYGEQIVLRDVDLTIYERDFLGIIGPNGGGKTTLVKIILGLLPPSSGKIIFSRECSRDGHPIMGYLPQYNVIDKKFPISVEEVILSGLNSRKAITGRFTRQHKEKAQETISRMGLEGLEKRPIGELSGGQLQRALLGRAIVSDPQIVILDEPSTYIDKHFEAKLYELLGEINKERAIVLVSHDIGTVLQNVKSIACVNETLDYHPDSGVTSEWLEKNFHCPIEVVGHGRFPHRVLKEHG